MRAPLLLIMLLGSLIILPLLLTSCSDGPEAFALGECRLGDADCRLE